METIVIRRQKDKEMETRLLTTGVNTPSGCLVTTQVRYSSSVGVTSSFIEGYNYDKELKDFVKIETIVDVIAEESKNVAEKLREKWKTF